MKMFQSHLISNIKRVMEIFNGMDINHPSLNGYLREILVSNMISPTLLRKFSIGTGKLIDQNDKKSTQQDIIIYSKELLPPILFDEKFGVFPYESVVMTIEVKTSFNKKNLVKSIEGSRYIDDFTHTTGLNIQGKQETHDFRFLNFLFAFKSDLVSVSNVGELKKYIIDYDKQNSRDGNNKYIHGICIVGVGFLFHDGNTWLAVNPDENFNEIIGFLRMISDLSILGFIKKQNPFLGNYLLENEKFQIL